MCWKKILALCLVVRLSAFGCSTEREAKQHRENAQCERRIGDVAAAIAHESDLATLRRSFHRRFLCANYPQQRGGGNEHDFALPGFGFAGGCALAKLPVKRKKLILPLVLAAQCFHRSPR
jgi:hypothetical protein